MTTQELQEIVREAIKETVEIIANQNTDKK
ncbi:hypothetical protein SAMN03097699_0770 [Flavobacteriaceae bacterium MAR_2010_188]|nr:hypothetical protein SAMN03097699_0770 [Flavobacteriaceae bacterium MAR_2010_188]